LPVTTVFRQLFLQVPAGSIGEEKAVGLSEAPLTEVMDLVGFALPDENNREPAAALATAAADTAHVNGCGFHSSTIGVM
jgi:hypothetical protein